MGHLTVIQDKLPLELTLNLVALPTTITTTTGSLVSNYISMTFLVKYEGSAGVTRFPVPSQHHQSVALGWLRSRNRHIETVVCKKYHVHHSLVHLTNMNLHLRLSFSFTQPFSKDSASSSSLSGYSKSLVLTSRSSPYCIVLSTKMSKSWTFSSLVMSRGKNLTRL